MVDLEKKRIYNRERMRIYRRSNPDYVEKEREYARALRSDPNHVEKRREYMKEYYRKPDGKERLKEYRSRPEVRERNKIYIRKYMRVYRLKNKNDCE